MAHECNRPFIVISCRAVIVLILAAVAWCSNPDKDHFERWRKRQAEQFREEVQENGDLSQLEKAHLERTNFALFSIVTVHTQNTEMYCGAFGRWWQVSNGSD